MFKKLLARAAEMSEHEMMVAINTAIMLLSSGAINDVDIINHLIGAVALNVSMDIQVALMGYVSGFGIDIVYDPNKNVSEMLSMEIGMEYAEPIVAYVKSVLDRTVSNGYLVIIPGRITAKVQTCEFGYIEDDEQRMSFNWYPDEVENHILPKKEPWFRFDAEYIEPAFKKCGIKI